MADRGRFEPVLDGDRTTPMTGIRTQLSATERLVEVAQELSLARDLRAIMKVVRTAARELTAADGATFVLRDGDQCFYADENAISPLWKGRRFPISDCISGWAMLNREAAVIEDIYSDPRIPIDAYRSTFVKSLAMVPIRTAAPVGAIGNYWASRHRATDGEVKLLRALADLTSVALQNVQLYAELENQILETHEAVRARDDFIRVAAHELRTPLTAMLLQLQRLEEITRREGEVPLDRISDSASRSVVSAKRFVALVNAMLDASRLADGPLQLNLEEFDIVEAANHVLEQLGVTAQRAECELRLQAAAPILGRWDRLRIEQIVTNLVSNALKYGPGKPVDVTVELRGTRVHIAVRDYGVGIAPDVEPHIFERFGRSGSVTHFAGLGLGLYLAREAIQAHGGAIDFSSVPNQGATFRVELPLRTEPPAG